MSVGPSAGGTPEHFDAVVVGSGFGGSVTAARLAEAGWRVCVLERGKRYPPNSFPRSPLDMKHNFWDPSEGLHGMFDLWDFSGLDAVCASGLGGGSLIYANVFLRKDERWFVHEDLERGGYEDWPVTRADLDPHYDEVERRVGVQRYPLEQLAYDQTPKVLAYREAAERLGPRLVARAAGRDLRQRRRGRRSRRADRTSRPNLHGRTRETCRLCGECDVGLQLRRQEHARLHLPDPGLAGRRRAAHPLRGQGLRAVRRRRLPRRTTWSTSPERRGQGDRHRRRWPVRR